MTYELKAGDWAMSIGRKGRKKRVHRDFSIMMRALNGIPASSASPAPPKTEPPKKRKWSKLLRSAKPAGNPDSLLDAMVEFTKRKSMHWAVVIHESAAPSGKQFKPRVFEICGKPPRGSLPEGDPDYGDVGWDRVLDDMSEDELDDLYDDDEEMPKPNTLGSTMQMRISSTIASALEEPNISEGGVFWDLLERLRSTTKFTNTEIQNEAKRTWGRQSNYRMFNNNCHRFCILLAIHLRAKQESALRILTGNILKAQSTEGPVSTPLHSAVPSGAGK